MRFTSHRWLQWLGRHELGTLLSVFVLGAGLWVFAELADEVGEGEAASFDERVLLALREPGDPSDPVGPAWVENAMRDVTALGGTVVLVPVVVAVAGFLVLRGAPGMAGLVALAGGSALGLVGVLKDVFDRPRPDLVPYTIETYFASFPSGHATGATAVYLALAALLAAVQPRTIVKAYLLTCSLLVAFAVGVSRVYLGVHWPSDVAAGWAIGAAWACAWWLLVGALLRRQLIRYPEPDPTSPTSSRTSTP